MRRSRWKDQPFVRFYKKVEIAYTTCWAWTAYRTPLGYGLFYYRGRMRPAHRVSWELHYGPIPDGLDVLHNCDTPYCVHPEHLFLGTQQTNMDDMVSKGRQSKGTARSQHKLTDADVVAIRQSTARPSAIAHQYGVDASHITKIKRHKKWKHIP